MVENIKYTRKQSVFTNYELTNQFCIAFRNQLLQLTEIFILS